MEGSFFEQLTSLISVGSLLATVVTIILAAVSIVVAIIAMKSQKKEESNSDRAMVDSLHNLVRNQSNDFVRVNQKYESLSYEIREEFRELSAEIKDEINDAINLIRIATQKIESVENKIDIIARSSTSEHHAIREEVFDVRKQLNK